MESERESTLQLKIDESVFERYLAMLDRNELPDWQRDAIIVYDKGARLSERVFQRKEYKTKDNIALFYNNKFYPILHTRAEETTLPTTTCVGTIVKCIDRILTTKRTSKGHFLRFSFNKAENANGSHFYLACEVEYDTDIENDDLLDAELDIFRHFNELIHDNITADALNLKESSRNDLFIATPPKVQMWSQYNPQETYKWAYKWNGIKAKMMVNDNIVCIWPDTLPIQTHTIDYGDLSTIERVNFQIELTATCLVLVPALSVTFNDGQVYMIEPYSSINFLDYIRPNLKGVILNYNNDDTIIKLPIRVQKFFDPPKQISYNTDKYDGFILIQRSMYIKWKQPTIDALYIGDSLFEVGDSKGQRVRFKLNAEDDATVINCIKNNIYELSANMRILRLRTDRLYCSTYKEYQLFINSISD